MDGWKKNRSSCSIAAYQVLSYEGANGIRVAAWKHPTRVDGEVFVEYEIQEPSPAPTSPGSGLKVKNMTTRRHATGTSFSSGNARTSPQRALIAAVCLVRIAARTRSMKCRAAKEIATQARGRASSLIFRIAPTAFAGTLGFADAEASIVFPTSDRS
jgi:hypothetical protein